MTRLTPFQTIMTRGRLAAAIGLSLLGFLLASPPVLAHHPLGGRLPANAFEGLMSGFAHPLIGLDHFAFVIAAGLVGVLIPLGVTVPLAFVLASLGGTGIHLMALDLPMPELIITLSVFIFGGLIAWGKPLNLTVIVLLGAIAGLFHGYAYGEAIVGAETTPVLSYLIGFSMVQLAISLGAWGLGTAQLRTSQPHGLLRVRFIGFILLGAGVTLLNGLILG